MQELVHLIASYGLLVAFASVFIDQGGVPIPAYPALIVTAALATDRGDAAWPIVAVAVAAALLADLAWFLAARRHGTALLRLMCRISLSPDSCVQATRGIFARWGVPSLTVAKFVPGFAAVATVLAGESRTPLRTFLLYDYFGALLWSFVGVAIGVFFHGAVNDALVLLEDFGHFGALVVLGAIGLFIAWKWLQRHRFVQALRLARVSPGELLGLMQSGEATLILDVRHASHRDESGWIPGSIHVVAL